MKMIRTNRILLVWIVIQLVIFCQLSFAGSKANVAVSDQIRCTVCGMFVAKYPNWLAQIHYDNLEEAKFFDGVKDMMAFFFNPKRYGGDPAKAVRDIFVKDYYSLKWLPAEKAFFVVGSDVYGPMGHELIPFETREAADSFSKDHHGKKILSFDEITPEIIEGLRMGQRMR